MPSDDVQAKLDEAVLLIKKGKLVDARKILVALKVPKAKALLLKLDEMADEAVGLHGKTYYAIDIARNPDMVTGIKGTYTMIRDLGLSGNFDNAMIAVNLLARHGWRMVAANVDREGTGVAFYAVMERVKRKAMDDE